MSHLGRSVYEFSSICDNSIDSNNCEDSFSTLSFCDLFLPLTPCLNENLIEIPQKTSLPLLEMDTMLKNRLLDVPEEEDSFPFSPSLAQLSPPGLEDGDISLGKVWFLNSPSVTGRDYSPNLSGIPGEDFKGLLSPAVDLDSQEKFDLLLGLVGCGPVEVTDPSKDCFQEEVAWLTRTTISTDHLALTGLTPGEFGETVVREDIKQVLRENVIPSTVPDILCDTEATSKTEVVKSSSKSRKRSRQSLEPGTEEYKKKRELNNISVRKSREKSRQKQQESEGRSEILSEENDRLQARVDSLEKELTILRGLFANIGATLPAEINTLLPAA